MLNYIFKSIKKYKGSFIFVMVGLFTIFSCIPVGIASLYTSKAIITEDIEKYGRGQYDILVRNEDSITALEKENKLIEENYIDGISGSISLDNYETIKGIPGIEVAAPIASLGYFADSNSTLGVTLPRDDKGYKIKLDYVTSDGVKDYTIKSGEVFAIPTIRKNILTRETTQQGIVDIATTIRENGSVNEQTTNSGIDPIMPYCLSYGIDMYSTYFKGNMSQVFYGDKEDEYGALFYKPEYFNYILEMPKTWSMLVAIDPEAEAKLSGVDSFIEEGIYLKNGEIKERSEKISEISDLRINYNEIPIIRNTSATYPFSVNMKIDKLDIDRHKGEKLLEDNLGDHKKLEEYDVSRVDFEENKDNPYLKFKDSTYESINNIGVLSSEEKTIDLTEYITPFKPVNIDVEPQNDWKSETGKVSPNIYQGTKYYSSTPLEYSKNGEEISVKAKDAIGDLLVFRDLEEHGQEVKSIVDNNKAVFKFTTVGSFDGGKLYNSDEVKLNGTPLGIYGDTYLTQVENEYGEKVENRKVYPTCVPGTIASSVPQGYTTLEAAALIKGDNPIDAIRVKVAGIDKYDDISKSKIQQIAMEINEKTGLHVDIVAGSSTQNIVASIEGKGEVQGIGKVIQRWVTLGTALKITDSWDMIGFILVMLFVICGFLFIINRISSYLLTRKNEIQILKSVGWGDKEIAKVICGENIVAAAISSALVIIMTIILNMKFEIKFLTEIVTVTLIIGNLLVVLISYLYPLISSRKRISYRGSMFNDSLNKMIINEVIRNKGRYILTVTQIALSGALGIFTYLSLQATRNNIGNTALGNQVNLSTNNMALILTIGAFALIIFTTFDRFSSIVDNRKREIAILNTLGWDKLNIGALIYGSLILIAFIGNIIAFIISLSCYGALYSKLPITTFKLILLIILMLGLSIVSGILPLIKATNATINENMKNNR